MTGLFRRLQALVMAALSFAALISAHEASAACDPKIKPTTFAQFKECVYQEPGSNVYIVDGDVPVVGETALKKFYQQLLADAASDLSAGAAPASMTSALRTESIVTPLGRNSVDLIVNRINDVDDVWSKSKRCGITYCVSRTSTGAHYMDVVKAMASASNSWTSNLGARMTHVEDQDATCTAVNSNVDFDVQAVSGQPYIARAFFPAQSRATRNVNIDAQAWSVVPPLTLEGVLRHELGHALGFRHEHTRPEAGQCFEDNSWRALTPYDSASVMHYPQCGGTAGWALLLSPRDIAGGIALYGKPPTCTSGVDCEQSCKSDRDSCLSCRGAGCFLPRTCVQQYKQCLAACRGTG